tara:strand:- start:18 stop:326 length:309 start_codon:yes stop_codon:yes gene_type:complete
MTSVFENEKKFRKGKKFKPKKTRGDKFRKDISSAIKESNIRKRRDKSFYLEPGSTKPKNIMNMEKSLENLKKDSRSNLAKGGSVARGCGAIMSDRKKKTRMV